MGGPRQHVHRAPTRVLHGRRSQHGGQGRQRCGARTAPEVSHLGGTLHGVTASVLDSFSAPVRAWFETSFAAPTDAQRQGWPPIAAGESTLLLAPTGSGKTLAAFLTAIDRLMFTEAPAKKERCRVLYVSPLKALAVDVERNLRAPLAGIATQGGVLHVPQVGIRTGDTPASERAQMLRTPPDILITTPESLYLMLTSQAREILRSVETVIVDE